MTISLNFINIGPFSRATLELKPLTIVIGCPGCGKSFLAKTLWSLTIATPDVIELAESVKDHGAEELVDTVLEHVSKGETPEVHFKNLLKIHIVELPKAIASSVREVIERVFNIEIHEFIKEGHNVGVISVYTSKSSLTFNIEPDIIKVKSYKPYLTYLDRLYIECLEPGVLRVINYETNYNVEVKISSSTDIINTILNVLADYIIHTYEYLFMTDDTSTILLADSYTSLKILSKLNTLNELLEYPYIHALKTYSKLVDIIVHNQVRTDLLANMLKRIGYNVEYELEEDNYRLYLRTWTNHKLPVEHAPPSFINTLVLSTLLASIREPWIIIVDDLDLSVPIELHEELVRLMYNATKELSKQVVVTTHNTKIADLAKQLNDTAIAYEIVKSNSGSEVKQLT